MIKESVKQLRPKKSDFQHPREEKRNRKKKKEKMEKRKKKQKGKMKRKKGRCRNDEPLKNVHFCTENTGEPPLNVWFSWS